MATSPPQPPLEAAWQALRPTLEGGDHFALIFIFSGNARLKKALYERAADLTAAQAKTMQRLGAGQTVEVGDIAPPCYTPC